MHEMIFREAPTFDHLVDTLRTIESEINDGRQ